MNLLIHGCSGTAPETSGKAFGTIQGTNEDDSQSDPHPEAGIFHNQTMLNSDPEMATAVVYRQNFSATIQFYKR